MNLQLLIIAMLVSLTSISQTVTTVTDENPDDGIALDSSGNIYLSEFGAGKVLKYSTSGEMTVFIEGLTSCNGLAFDSNDNLFVCDYLGQAVVKYDSDGNQLDSYPVAGNASGIIRDFDSDDMIFCTYDGNSIYRLATDGTITQIASGGDLNGPVGLAFDDEGSLYAGNFNDAKIYRILSSGDMEYVAEVVANGGGPFLGFITYSQGNLWGTMLDSHEIYSINPDGIDDITYFAGNDEGSLDGDISEATFSYPSGIAFNNTGDVMYVTDSGTRNLRIISGIPLSITDNKLIRNNLSIFPNPTHGIVTLKLLSPSDGTYTIRIMDTAGKIVSSLENISHDSILSGKELNMSTLESGLYVVEISSEMTVITKKLLKL